MTATRAAERTAVAADQEAGEPDERTATAARLRVAIGRLARRLRKQHSGGLSAAQLSTLVVVEAHEGIRLGHLAALEGISASSMTRLVAGLTDAGLVLRRPDPVDARSVRVALSAVGKGKLDAVRRDRTAFLIGRIHRLGADDYARLVAALPVLETLLGDEPEAAPRDRAS